ncbi:hypothetical protein K4B79_20515 [Streptomyces lincolnensis]|uniref:hypothetical protein n=1 Tax=Streptomyces lincolnensis TaxID=1915 RepID=UPI001E4CCD2B|nr:hypothetical protein [Streptomyces lincolnensis]MCD7440596.1 hypothetical protein [Streptomyces lincolnensis]
MRARRWSRTARAAGGRCGDTQAGRAAAEGEAARAGRARVLRRLAPTGVFDKQIRKMNQLPG